MRRRSVYRRGGGQLISAVLLTLMGRVWMYVALPSSQMNSSARTQARSSNARVRACRTNWKGTGNEGVSSDDVPKSFVLPGLKSMFLYACNPDMHGERPPSHSAHLKWNNWNELPDKGLAKVQRFAMTDQTLGRQHSLQHKKNNICICSN